jgi:hypothetical protein
MIITEEMWKTMQNNMAELQLKVLKLTGKVNAMDARIYGRARSERWSVPQVKHAPKCDLSIQGV